MYANAADARRIALDNVGAAMTKMVRSSIHGGAQYATATLDLVHGICSRLGACAADLKAQAIALSNARMRVAVLRTSTLQWCPEQNGMAALRAPVCESSGFGRSLHVHVEYLRLTDHAESARSQLHALAVQCERIADVLARAYGLYSEAEAKSRMATNRALQWAARVAPATMAKFTIAQALGGWLYGVVTEGNFSAAHALNAISWQQDGLMRAASAAIGLHDGQSPVPSGAYAIGGISSRATNLIQGDALTVESVDPHEPSVAPVSDMGGALANLRRLSAANADSTHGEYATIAISRYVDADGRRSWLVTIPGTDGNFDSPLGWEQNVELMSANAMQRRNADSARMVVEAMRQAGIGRDERVALIGHSQGGIIAATLASDYADEYRIEHIVTAGSPIANHPMGKGTWVTSIEMEDELVAALDGEVNPRSEQWLTIRGEVRNVADGSPADANGAVDDGTAAMTAVDQSHQGKYELTHDLAYHTAAYENALSLGSEALANHDSHFMATIHGDYMETTYWSGRMEHGKHDIEMDDTHTQ